jgi:DNA-binding GntR family transcriptional regulator
MTSLSEQVHEKLRRAIILGRYAQGSRLPEVELAKDLDASRVPLREALPRLEVEGFVRTNPRRSAVVETWTPEAVTELFDVRLAIEVPAAGMAARRIADGRPSGELTAAMDRSDRELARARLDSYRVAETSTALHEAIVVTTGNRLLLSLMRAVSGRILWLFYLTSQRDARTACAEHHDLLDAVTTGNSRLAESIAYAHIERGRAPSLDALAGNA